MTSDTLVIRIHDGRFGKNSRGRTLVYNKSDIGEINHAKMFIAEVAKKINTPIEMMRSKEILDEQGIEIIMKDSQDAVLLGDVLEDIV